MIVGEDRRAAASVRRVSKNKKIRVRKLGRDRVGAASRHEEMEVHLPKKQREDKRNARTIQRTVRYVLFLRAASCSAVQGGGEEGKRPERGRRERVKQPAATGVESAGGYARENWHPPPCTALRPHSEICQLQEGN